MSKKLPIGIDDFRDLRNADYYYVDKSLFIKELISAGPGKVTLIPRPRRFGKTLNMTMLKYFFEKHEHEKSYTQLFEGLKIAKHPEYMQHQDKYPVIFLTFKDIKEGDWASCYDKLKRRISAEFERHTYLLQKNTLTQQQQKDFDNIINRSASQSAYEDSIKDLAFYLAKYYGIKPVILIDEYDTPVHAGFLYKYYDKVISFMRGLMCSGLKGNANLTFGVVTGIMRVAKESIFSGMNNLKVCSLLNNRYADKFGLTEPEVKALLATYKLSKEFDAVCMWYNGYRVGLPKGKVAFTRLYNPWSILSFVDEEGVFAPYWVNTSDNKLVQEFMRKASADIKQDFELIFANKPVRKKICEDIVFPSIDKDSNTLWSFLVFAGYMTWQSRERMHIKCDADLVAPNREVLDCLKNLVSQWFSEATVIEDYRIMLNNLVRGNVDDFAEYFQKTVLQSMSYFDTTQNTPERVYHAFVLGMLVSLQETHEVKSNREEGFGRYDVCLIPKNHHKPGIIIEFKVFKKSEKTLKVSAQKALEQIEAQKYEAGMRALGLKHIVKIGIAFKAKRVFVASRDSLQTK